MVKVYTQTPNGSARDLVAVFEDEEVYDACLASLIGLAKTNRLIITESIEEQSLGDLEKSANDLIEAIEDNVEYLWEDILDVTAEIIVFEECQLKMSKDKAKDACEPSEDPDYVINSYSGISKEFEKLKSLINK